MSRPTYRDYRRWGHTRFHAAALAVPIWVMLVGATFVGALAAAIF